jgi:hypothetical protein
LQHLNIESWISETDLCVTTSPSMHVYNILPKMQHIDRVMDIGNFLRYNFSLRLTRSKESNLTHFNTPKESDLK